MWGGGGDVVLFIIDAKVKMLIFGCCCELLVCVNVCLLEDISNFSAVNDMH